ncbi:MAG: hypothetical protein AAFP19_19305 [Bacteroidota bacterium]
MKRICLFLCCFMLVGLATGIAQSAANAGKIWIQGDRLFINSPAKGVQVMDNSNPRRPEAVGFVAIPGNVDFAVFDNLMYANHYDDLVVFDWEAYINDSELEEVARFEGLFPQHQAPQDQMAAMQIGMIDSRVSSSQSMGGSMACFSFDHPASPGYLYAANTREVHVIDVNNTDKPRQLRSVNIVRRNSRNSSEIETVFVHNERLYLGMPDGMVMYSLDNPDQPSYEGEYGHLVGCDPVVAQNNMAYVTVRSGTTCNSTMNLNQLHIVNVANPSMSVREGSYQLTNPHGLGIDGNLLFVCDGTDGLKVLDVTNSNGIRLLARESTAGTAYDVIVQSDKRQLIVVSGDHVIQYQYSATGKLRKLGEFKLDYS